MIAVLLALLLLPCASGAMDVHPLDTIDTLSIPGTPAFVRVARDVLHVHLALHPQEDAVLVGLEADARDELLRNESDDNLLARLDTDLAALRSMPWRSWSVDRQIDFRLVYAQATGLRHSLATKTVAERSANWLNARLWLRERLVKAGRPLGDLDTWILARAATAVELHAENAFDAIDLGYGLWGTQAVCSLSNALNPVCQKLPKQTAQPQVADTFARTGRSDYDWRLHNMYLVPWNSAQLVRMAERALPPIAAAIAALHHLEAEHPCAPSTASPADLMQSAVAENIDAMRRSGFVSVPNVGEVTVARQGVYADLMSDHGEVHPAVAFGSPNATWLIGFPLTARDRCDFVWATSSYRESPLNYAIAHETVPGHHLQGTIARNNPNALRKFFVSDNFAGEGWALYAESLALRSGAFGQSNDARYYVYEALRRRTLRVLYDVHLQDGSWTVAQTRAFRRVQHGESDLVGFADELWYAEAQPLGLVRYFAGKTQLDELHDAYRKKLGAKFNERAFNDAVLAEGLIPIALVRAKLLGEPIPDL